MQTKLQIQSTCWPDIRALMQFVPRILQLRDEAGALLVIKLLDPEMVLLGP